MNGADPRSEDALAPGESAEAARQRCLLAALATTCPRTDGSAAPATSGGGHPEAGLLAYRTNAHACAERALTAALPTLRALIGAEDFAHLAREFWHADPPQRGDLGVWGDALPAWLDAHPGLAEWPYLGDCARLDLALHHCERAADATLDAATLALLADHDPERLRLRLRPGVQCMASRWPIAQLRAAHAAHAAHEQVAESAFETAAAQMRAGSGESVVVARDAWRAVVQVIDASGLAFMQALLRDADLAEALSAAGEGFDFSAWLAAALRCQWLQRVELRSG